MTRRSISSPQGGKEENTNLARAVETMTAPELRLALHEVLDQLEDEPRRRAVDSLLARAANGSAAWKPSRPSARIVDDAMSFAAAVRQVGYADPGDVSDYLRRGSRAYLAGDHATARGVFGALLPLIAVGEIDLGQHEPVSDVLNVDAHACVAQYVATVYTTTPLADRADAVHRATAQVEGVSSLLSPIQEMEDVSAGALPDLAAFLPLWVKRLERHRPARRNDWEDKRRECRHLHCPRNCPRCSKPCPRKSRDEVLWILRLDDVNGFSVAMSPVSSFRRGQRRGQRDFTNPFASYTCSSCGEVAERLKAAVC
jgi:hypothetical protein